ncbi:helix-turn-helix domain-containing protein [Sinorhizobium medicae]|nr:helix-turn-helix domain-containing protein [Sinorhizobium medicae]
MNTIAHIRKSVLKVSQSELADVAGTKQATVSRWETNQLSPDLEQLKSIREEVLRRGLDWDDAWFFSAPEAVA